MSESNKQNKDAGALTPKQQVRQSVQVPLHFFDFRVFFFIEFSFQPFSTTDTVLYATYSICMGFGRLPSVPPGGAVSGSPLRLRGCRSSPRCSVVFLSLGILRSGGGGGRGEIRPPSSPPPSSSSSNEKTGLGSRSRFRGGIGAGSTFSLRSTATAGVVFLSSTLTGVEAATGGGGALFSRRSEER